MALHSSILPWRTPWAEDPRGLQSLGSQKVGHDWSNLGWIPALVLFIFYHMDSSYSWPLNSSVKSLSHVRLFVTPWTAACQSSLSITNSQSLLKLRSIESVMPSNHLILCHPLLLLPSILPSIRVFSKESVPHIRWLKYWSFSFSIRPSNEHPGLIS